MADPWTTHPPPELHQQRRRYVRVASHRPPIHPSSVSRFPAHPNTSMNARSFAAPGLRPPVSGSNPIRQPETNSWDIASFLRLIQPRRRSQHPANTSSNLASSGNTVQPTTFSSPLARPCVPMNTTSVIAAASLGSSLGSPLRLSITSGKDVAGCAILCTAGRSNKHQQQQGCWCVRPVSVSDPHAIYRKPAAS